MPEKLKVVVQKNLVENGRGERVVPVHYTFLQIPKKKFDDAGLNKQAHEKAMGVQDSTHHSSNFASIESMYGAVAFYIESPQKEHTGNIARAIAKGFGLEIKVV